MYIQRQSIITGCLNSMDIECTYEQLRQLDLPRNERPLIQNIFSPDKYTDAEREFLINGITPKEAKEHMGMKKPNWIDNLDPDQIIIIDVGDNVICDWCDQDYTHSDKTGGILFTSHAICPDCTPRALVSIKKHNEERFILARAEPDETFKDFVLRIR